MPAPRLAPGDIPKKAMTYILKGLRTIRYGEIVLVAQDGILMQVEWSEKRRLDCWQESEDGENSYTERALADLAARIRAAARVQAALGHGRKSIAKINRFLHALSPKPCPPGFFHRRLPNR